MSPGLLVAPCSRAAATHAVKTWHYSRAMPAGRLITHGVWEDGSFIGAVVYGRGASPMLLRRFGLTQTEGCELVRVALTKHSAPVTAVVARSLALLRSTNPGLRLVVSFADPEQGHVGGIYQAGNWTYTGTSARSLYFVDSAGRKWHPRQVSNSGVIKEFGQVKRCGKRSDMREVKFDGKHRYVMPLDRAMRRAVKASALPYPTLAGEASKETRPGPPAEAGSIPAARSDEMAG